MYFNNTTTVLRVNPNGTKANARVCVYFGYLPFLHPLFHQFGNPTAAAASSSLFLRAVGSHHNRCITATFWSGV